MPRLTLEQRYEIAILDDLGWSCKRIMRRFNISFKTYKKWKNRKSVENADQKRNRGHRKLNAAIRRRIYSDLTVRNMSLRQVSKKYGVCHQTVKNYLTDFNTPGNEIKPYRQPIKLPLTTQQLSQRLSFCRFYYNYNWKKVFYIVIFFLNFFFGLFFIKGRRRLKNKIKIKR